MKLIFLPTLFAFLLGSFNCEAGSNSTGMILGSGFLQSENFATKNNYPTYFDVDLGSLYFSLTNMDMNFTDGARKTYAPVDSLDFFRWTLGWKNSLDTGIGKIDLRVGAGYCDYAVRGGPDTRYFCYHLGGEQFFNIGKSFYQWGYILDLTISPQTQAQEMKITPLRPGILIAIKFPFFSRE